MAPAQDEVRGTDGGDDGARSRHFAFAAGVFGEEHAGGLEFLLEGFQCGLLIALGGAFAGGVGDGDEFFEAGDAIGLAVE